MRFVSLAIIACGITACNSSSTAPISASASARMSANYKYEVRGKGGMISRGQGESLTATWDGNEVLSVKDGRLTVNGKSYGPLKDGDSILVNEEGKVTVNGVSRTPE